jgi:hypothetical protein
MERPSRPAARTSGSVRLPLGFALLCDAGLGQGLVEDGFGIRLAAVLDADHGEDDRFQVLWPFKIEHLVGAEAGQANDPRDVGDGCLGIILRGRGPPPDQLCDGIGAMPFDAPQNEDDGGIQARSRVIKLFEGAIGISSETDSTGQFVVGVDPDGKRVVIPELARKVGATCGHVWLQCGRGKCGLPGEHRRSRQR